MAMGKKGLKQPPEETAAAKEQKAETRGFYLETVKFIRDLVHGYVYLTKFQLRLIDTIEFQRLKDIRQLTCQHVYPAAKHTRFDHSLGVLELTRQALKNLNRNGIITTKKTNLFSDELQFNAELAALLHDVGHCPFSHLGEIEFDKDTVWKRLYRKVRKKLSGSALAKEFQELEEKGKKKPGAVHEQLSCIAILTKFYEELSQVEKVSNREFYVDFELLIRSILGFDYDVSSTLLETSETTYLENQKKNAIVHLINSRVFDMDKLDYIMRDSHMTGIGTPVIDTHRLFRNMYLDDKFSLVFTSRAVPVLQNMIESRDGLYMYVYNHHAVVFSDFMYSYIFRRLDHNFRDYKALDKSIKLSDECPVAELGILSKKYLFSPSSILLRNKSDSDLLAQLNSIYHALHEQGCKKESSKKLKATLQKQIARDTKRNPDEEIKLGEPENILLSNTHRVYLLIERYLNRDYLKPWWKTYAEFSSFIERHFLSDKMRKQLCDWICNRKDDRPAGDEFRSQLAKHVNAITNRLCNDGLDKKCGLLQPLKDGEFFVIERSTRFFDPETIRELDIALKINTILGPQSDIKYSTSEYYVKELTNIMPQRDYYSLYAKNSFYVFSRPLDDSKYPNPTEREQHYKLIEEIFVFVAKELIDMGADRFWVKFQKENCAEVEEESQDDLYKRFLKYKRLEKELNPPHTSQ